MQSKQNLKALENNQSEQILQGAKGLRLQVERAGLGRGRILELAKPVGEPQILCLSANHVNIGGSQVELIRIIEHNTGKLLFT